MRVFTDVFTKCFTAGFTKRFTGVFTKCFTSVFTMCFPRAHAHFPHAYAHFPRTSDPPPPKHKHPHPLSATSILPRPYQVLKPTSRNSASAQLLFNIRSRINTVHLLRVPFVFTTWVGSGMFSLSVLNAFSLSVLHGLVSPRSSSSSSSYNSWRWGGKKERGGRGGRVDGVLMLDGERSPRAGPQGR
jgi:hypothetical protein